MNKLRSKMYVIRQLSRLFMIN